jgi:hypothetical protein
VDDPESPLKQGELTRRTNRAATMRLMTKTEMLDRFGPPPSYAAGQEIVLLDSGHGDKVACRLADEATMVLGRGAQACVYKVTNTSTGCRTDGSAAFALKAGQFLPLCDEVAILVHLNYPKRNPHVMGLQFAS